jgi:hypothetical protein
MGNGAYLIGGEILGIVDKCLDVSGANPADGTPIISWSCRGGTNQIWAVE